MVAAKASPRGEYERRVPSRAFEHPRFRVEHHEQFGSHRSTLINVGSSSGSILPVLTKAMGDPVDPYHPHGEGERTHQQRIYVYPAATTFAGWETVTTTSLLVPMGTRCIHGVACAAGPFVARGCIALCNCDRRTLPFVRTPHLTRVNDLHRLHNE